MSPTTEFEHDGVVYPVALLEWIDTHNNDDLPDGAWWAVLENAAEEWLAIITETEQQPMSGQCNELDAFDAVHAYLHWKPRQTKGITLYEDAEDELDTLAKNFNDLAHPDAGENERVCKLIAERLDDLRQEFARRRQLL